MEVRHRVLVQLNSLELGGTQINAVDLAAAMTSRGFDSVLIGPADTLPTQGSSLFDVARPRGVTVEVFERPKTTMSGARDLTEAARRFGADLVHVYGSWHHRPAYWGPCRFGRSALVLTVYEMAFDDTTHRGPELIIGTGYLRDDLQGRGPGGVHLISPPVDVDRDDTALFSKAEIAQFRGDGDPLLTLVIVSRLDEEMKAKSVELTIAGVDALGDRPVQLLIVGSGNAAGRLRALGEKVNARHGRPVVRFLGPMADPRVAYAAADVVVGMGGSAARGLAFGKPLIVSGEFGWFRLFTPETSAMLFRNSFWSDVAEPDPLIELTRAIERLIGNADLGATLGAFGRDFAVSQFGLSAMADKLAGVYSKAIREYNRARWMGDLPVEAAMIWRRLTKGHARPGAQK